MDQRVPGDISPYTYFTRSQWAALRADTPMTLTPEEVEKLQGLNDPVSMAEVRHIYLPLSRLIAYYAQARQGLHRATTKFLGRNNKKVPYVIGVAGSVAVGKSATARILRELLSRWPSLPRVELVTTDGFLLPNAVLEREGLMERKGFPESYDTAALLRFVSDIKAGRDQVAAPRYSHLIYDVLPGERTIVSQPDILVLEGLNILQTEPRPVPSPKEGRIVPYVSDFLDFAIYIDASEKIIEHWYVERFMRLRETAFKKPESFFHRYSKLSDDEADATARAIWERINLVNLRENILPSRPRADLILSKGPDHGIDIVALRKL